jgi:hypothetical protein
MIASGRRVLGDLWPLLVVGAPLLFAFPVIDALVGSVKSLLPLAHPFFADLSGTAADASAVALGAPLYQDPSVGYTPLTYTPLYNVLGGGLDLIVDWDGWPQMLTFLAEFALIALAAWLAYRPAARAWPIRLATLGGAIGLGAIAFWLVEFVPFNGVFAPRPDMLAWAFSLAGLVLVPKLASGSRTALVAAVVLLTLGWWTKQPVIVTALAAVVWLTVAAARGTAEWRTWAGFVGGLSLLGATSFGLAHVLTDGWSTAFVIEIPGDRGHPFTLGRSIRDLQQAVSAAAVVAGAFWLAVVFADGKRPRWWPGRSERSAIPANARAVGSVLLLFVLLDIPASLFFRDAVGAAHNQFLGIAWALGLLAALGWGVAQHARTGALAAAAIVVALFALSESPRTILWLHEQTTVLVPRKSQRAIIFQQPTELVELARDHLIYHPAYPGIGVEDEADLYPGQDNVTSLTWSGRQPLHLVDALMDRRFDLVYPLARAGGTGRWEDNYVWKINEVMRANYRQDADLPETFEAARIVPYPFLGFVAGRPMLRRPGPPPAPWMANCFGPFEIDGISWRIAAGGGFWCRPGGRGPVLELVRTPARVSEIRADDYEGGEAGRIIVSVGRPGVVEVRAGGEGESRALKPGKPGSFAVSAESGGISVLAEGDSGARVNIGALAPD